MSKISIILIGDLARQEFQGIRELLESLAQIRVFPNLEPAIAVIEEGDIAAELVIIAQSYPGEFTRQTIDRLREVSPLSRLIAILGSWCEGEMRSGLPWPTVIRMYWHQGLDRLEREISLLARGECPSWGLPLTATEEERLIAATPTGEKPNAHRKGVIGIVTQRFESFDWLSAACRHRGYATLWLRGSSFPPGQGFDVIIAEGTGFYGKDGELLQNLAACYPSAKRIALTDFPRIEDRCRLLQAGATSLFSKPLNVEEMFEVLEG